MALQVRGLARWRCSLSRRTGGPGAVVPYHTVPYLTVPCHTVPYLSIPYHTILLLCSSQSCRTPEAPLAPPVPVVEVGGGAEGGGRDGGEEEEQGGVVEPQQGGGALAQDLFDYADDGPGQGDELGGHLTSGCLSQWREGQHSTLSDMLTPVTLQITDFTLMGGKPTGQVVVSDGTRTVSAMLGHPGTPRATFIELHQNRRFHLFSLVTVQQTSGPPENLTIVRDHPI